METSWIHVETDFIEVLDLEWSMARYTTKNTDIEVEFFYKEDSYDRHSRVLLLSELRASAISTLPFCTLRVQSIMA